MINAFAEEKALIIKYSDNSAKIPKLDKSINILKFLISSK